MTAIFSLILVAAALTAAGFAVWPVLRAQQLAWRARVLLAGATSAFILAIGLGAYLTLGSPLLAIRTLPEHPGSDDTRALIAMLAHRVRDVPNDPKAWMWLGRGYMTLGDPAEAAAAFKRGIAVARPEQKSDFYSAYGEALTVSSSGIVTPEAQEAFELALKSDPKDVASRYFLGLAHAMRNDNAPALALWQSLLADTPADSALHGELVDRIAALSAKSGNAPDIAAMVASLAARLHEHPDDADGWQRLVRAYAVLGDKPKARAAYADGQKALAKNAAALAALDAEARDFKLK